MAQHGYYQGNKVELYNIQYSPKGSSKKYRVYVKQGSKDAEGRIKAHKYDFGSKEMPVQRDIDKNRKSFRARFGCDDKSKKDSELSKIKSQREKDVKLSYKDTKNYWNCKTWEKSTPINKLIQESVEMKEGIYYLRKLQRIEMFAKKLMECIDKGSDLPSWIQDKLTLSEHNLEATYNYYKTKELNSELGGDDFNDQLEQSGNDCGCEYDDENEVNHDDDSQYATKDDVEDAIENHMETAHKVKETMLKEKKNKEYWKVFDETLKSNGVEKFDELKGKQKYKFFSDLDKSWEGKKEKMNESIDGNMKASDFYAKFLKEKGFNSSKEVESLPYEEKRKIKDEFFRLFTSNNKHLKETFNKKKV